MNRDKVVLDVAVKLTKDLADQGKLVYGGWAAYEFLCLQNADAAKKTELRRAWFLSAEHVFTSILSFMEGDREPTEADFDKLTKLHNELIEFRKSEEKKL